jgi:hypothetical protein
MAFVDGRNSGTFLLHCKQYNTYRQTMIYQLLQLGVTNFNLTILLSGKTVQPIADYPCFLPHIFQNSSTMS